ncbi:MAG TPA: hypothetical protein VIM88_03245 [Sulfurovum sp.]|uniref:hypothetical protein n=1 Tax=Sulfurovum sp. TaxID=1969726 RepID=UPI002F94AFE3
MALKEGIKGNELARRVSHLIKIISCGSHLHFFCFLKKSLLAQTAFADFGFVTFFYARKKIKGTRRKYKHLNYLTLVKQSL